MRQGRIEMPIQALIVDDEPLARERIATLLTTENDVCVIGGCGDGRSAARAIQREAPDLVFLDIQLPEMDGFEMLASLPANRMPAVIFVTAYDQFALRAFKVHAVDYLLKPVNQQDLLGALGHFRQQRTAGEQDLKRRLSELMRDLEAQRARSGRLILKTDGEVFCLRPSEIDWVESAGNYVCFHVGSQTHVSRETMHAVEQKLRVHNFVRVHRSAIVNLDRIRRLKPLLYGDYMIELRDGTKLPLSRAYRQTILQKVDGA